MTLYEIDSRIAGCLQTDPETGEVLGIDAETLDVLQMERRSKVEGVVLWLKNLSADAAAYKAEKEAFAKRQEQAERTIDGLKRWLTEAVGGEEFKTDRCLLRWRKSDAVEVDETKLPKKYMVRTVIFKPDKKTLKDLLKQGHKIKGAALITKQNPQIK